MGGVDGLFEDQGADWSTRPGRTDSNQGAQTVLPDWRKSFWVRRGGRGVN